MVQTGNTALDAFVAELELQCIALLEANASKAGEIAALREELTALKEKLKEAPNDGETGERPARSP